MIFNSLGSNYTFEFSVNSLFSPDREDSEKKLSSFLRSKYSGRAVLLYKGREAIKMALQSLGLPYGSKVGITGLTCFAVYEAVKEAGYKADYIDIESGTLNFGLSELKKHSGIRVLIIQNTLGIPCDIDAMKKYCREKEIVLIEDLAHSVGTKYKNGKEAGTEGDFVALSFSQDKSIDGVSGGALIVRNPGLVRVRINPAFEEINSFQRFKDRIYPFLTFLIRWLYPSGLGKFFHFVLKKAGLLSLPMGSDKIGIHNLPGWYCDRILIAFHDMKTNLAHRRHISEVYAQNIDDSVLLRSALDNIELSSNLRFPIIVDHRDSLVKFLRVSGIYVSDIWYDSPVAPKRYLSKTDYKGDCRRAEMVSRKILNLPTHVNITKENAIYIAGKINQWLNTH